MKITMWSGPRNLSTAMMYSFGNRPDVTATDEPFYAAYLAATGLDHPMRAEILASQPNDPAAVASHLSGPTPNAAPHWYQKHMTQHMIESFPLDWAEGCVHVHLIRHPARVIASYAAKREDPTLEDLGFRQHYRLFERFPGPVIDSADIRRDPESSLRRLCAEIGLEFDPAMLGWSAGPRGEDGVWAAHWYGQVHASTGFAGVEGPLPELTGPSAVLADRAAPYYDALARWALR